MRFTPLLATAATAAVLGSAGVSIAGATSEPATPVVAETTGEAAAPPAAPEGTAAEARPKAERRAKAKARREHRRRARRAAIKRTADTIGVSPADLVRELKDGKTVAEIATAHGIDPQTVIDALVAAAHERIDRAQSAGKISEERAAQAKERAAVAIETRVHEGRKRP